MDLVNEYLRSVALLLPKAQRDDIVAELHDTILTRIETREAGLGRPLTEGETEAVLREVGHPLVVAARYREGPQHAVGPALYPYWAFAVKIGITIQIILAVVILLIGSIAGDFPGAFVHAIGSVITGSLILIGLATVAGWLIERQGLRIDYLNTWRVRDLRFLEFAAWDLDAARGWFARRSVGAPRGWASGRSRSRRIPWAGRSIIGSALTSIVGGTVFVLVWTRAVPFDVVGHASDLQDLGLVPGPLAEVDWHGLWVTLFWPILAYSVFIILRGVLALAWPRAARLHGLMQAISGAAVVGFCGWLWNLSPIAAAIRVDSVSGFALRMTEFEAGTLVPIVPILTVTVEATAFIGACVALVGLWRMVVGGGAATGDHGDRPA